MGLADLKKNAASCNNRFSKQMSVDEFIETASLYALGKTHEFDNGNQSTNVVDFINRLNKQQPNAKHTAHFRRATFTLSEQAISQLSQFSQQSKLAKSKLIRHLINEHHQLTQQEKQSLYQKFELQTAQQKTKQY